MSQYTTLMAGLDQPPRVLNAWNKFATAKSSRQGLPARSCRYARELEVSWRKPALRRIWFRFEILLNGLDTTSSLERHARNGLPRDQAARGT
jgi:hypothetical protein